MSLGSILGKILGVGGAAIAAPFTGGGSLSALPAILGAGGAAAGAMANSAAGNREAKFGGQMDLASLMMQRDDELQRLKAQADNDYTSNQIARENSGMNTRDDAWRKLLSAQHTLSPSQMPMVSKYQAPQRQATDAEQQGANALTSEVMARLQGGNPIAPVERRDPSLAPINVDPKLLNPGGGERLGGILSPILTGIGAIGSAPRNYQMPTMGTPGAPILSPGDLAWLRTQNPALGA